MNIEELSESTELLKTNFRDENFISIIANFRIPERIFFDGNNASAAATQLAANQVNFHSNLIKFAVHIIRSTNFFRIPQTEIDYFTQSVDLGFAELRFTIADKGDRFFVQSNPSGSVYSQEDIDTLKRHYSTLEKNMNVDPREIAEIGILILAVYAMNLAPAYNLLQSNDFPRLSALMAIQASRIETVLLLKNKTGDFSQDFAGILEKFRLADNQFIRFAQQFSNLQSSMEKVAEETLIAGSGVEKLSSKIADVKEFQENQIKSIREQLKLDEARKLWGNLAKRGSWAFWLSAILLITFLVGAPLLILQYHTGILEFFRAIEDALAIPGNANTAAMTVSAVARLIVVSAPLGFLIWLIRLVVRFNTRSMLMMDDANARVTMLDTFLFMIEQGASRPEDRGAILEALFRRSPGHGGDSADPPNFVDLLKYGKEKAN